MRRSLAGFAFLTALRPAAASAKPRDVATPSRAPSRGESTSLRAQMGVPVAQKLLQSDVLATRVRGVERLGAIGTPEAIDALVEALEGSSGPMADARVRLTAVRVLAGETKRDNVRQFFVREVTDTSRGDGRGGMSPLAGVLRGTAALALARGGDRKAVAALVSTLLRPGAAEADQPEIRGG